MAQEILLFFIIFAAGLLIFTFVAIVWMTAIWEKMSVTYRQNMARRMLEKRGIKI